MNGAVMAVVVVAALAVVTAIALGVRAVNRGRAAQNEAWLSVAREIGLSFEPETLTARARLSGTFEGAGVDVQSRVESSGQTSSRFTRYRISYPPLGMSLDARATGVWQRLTGWFGAQDIETGDAQFDPAVTVRGDDERKVRDFLTAARRMSIHRLVTEFRGASVGDAAVTWKAPGLESDRDRLITVIRRLAGVAHRLTGPVGVTDRAMEMRASGSPAEAAAMLEAESGLEDLFDRAESAYSGGSYHRASEALAGLEEALPADEAVAAWRRRADERRAGLALPAPDAGAILDPGGVAADLFAPGMLSYEAARVFEDGYEGREIRWAGTVVRAAPYRRDHELGDGPGVRAVIRVHRLGWDLYGGRDVDAVVAFPEGTKLAEGTEVAFAGRLSGADALMRNLFVVEGSLGG